MVTQPRVQPRPGLRGGVPHRAASSAYALGVPAVVVGTGVLVAWRWRGDLPEPLTVPWGAGLGAAATTLGGHLGLMVGVVAAVCLYLWSVAFWSGRETLIRRFACGVAVWAAVFVTSTSVGALGAHAGVVGARGDGALAAGIAVASLAGVVTAWLTPGDPPRPVAPVLVRAAVVELDDGERWETRPRQLGAQWLSTAALLSAVLVAVLTSWWVGAVVVGLVVGLVLLVVSGWVVRVGLDGVQVRGPLGRPVVDVPVQDVTGARVVAVHAFRDFGGWGLRAGTAPDGRPRAGLVLRSGPALEVSRVDAPPVVVTIEDADTAAALVNALVARNRARAVEAEG
ncbi:hypothetical protein [Cellulomonas bogoriensis]|uniref:DUF1648 domain-containing protein n=1 Tax=Cellulomonas bogoriensis 69B4 = DSM 16987 TaxID=1386082 RepID=A0A0A0BJU8_9CELL|nr:hypothetical protein [Cellulomonas bogoriensis]KGM08773.1 hypothetical protein N869_06780 [Cellulomonas bogoriensis 69B4 = DSM 16987]